MKIHETAIVDDGAFIGQNTNVWHWTHICKGAKIGESCNIGQNVYVSSKAVIGDNVKIQNNVSIYDNVLIEDDVFCGPSMVFTNVKNPRSFVNRKNEYKTTLIKKGATLGANCTIVCGTTVGKYAFVGAGAVVTKNIKDFALVAGVPAKQIGWVSENGISLELPLSGNGSTKCNVSDQKYILIDGICYKEV